MPSTGGHSHAGPGGQRPSCRTAKNITGGRDGAGRCHRASWWSGGRAGVTGRHGRRVTRSSRSRNSSRGASSPYRFTELGPGSLGCERIFNRATVSNPRRSPCWVASGTSSSGTRTLNRKGCPPIAAPSPRCRGDLVHQPGEVARPRREQWLLSGRQPVRGRCTARGLGELEDSLVCDSPVSDVLVEQDLHAAVESV